MGTAEIRLMPLGGAATKDTNCESNRTALEHVFTTLDYCGL